MFLRCPAVVLQSDANLSRCSTVSLSTYALSAASSVDAMPDYHHTVIAQSTPFREFTKWCQCDELGSMDDKSIRIANLKALLKEAFDDNQSRMAAAARKNSGGKERKPSFFNDLLSGRKSFGGALARTLEREFGL